MLQLAKFAHSLIRDLEVNPSDYNAEDIVQVVIEKNLDGSRGQDFDPSKGTLLNWLKRQIRWEILNKLDLSRTKSEVPLLDDGDNDYNGGELEHLIQIRAIFEATQFDTPENFLVSEQDAQAIWYRLYEVASEDEEIESLVSALEDGCDWKTQNLAEVLNWNPERVNNVKKRLKRRLTPSEAKRRTK